MAELLKICIPKLVSRTQRNKTQNPVLLRLVRFSRKISRWWRSNTLTSKDTHVLVPRTSTIHRRCARRELKWRCDNLVCAKYVLGRMGKIRWKRYDHKSALQKWKISSAGAKCGGTITLWQPRRRGTRRNQGTLPRTCSCFNMRQQAAQQPRPPRHKTGSCRPQIVPPWPARNHLGSFSRMREKGPGPRRVVSRRGSSGQNATEWASSPSRARAVRRCRRWLQVRETRLLHMTIFGELGGPSGFRLPWV